jgi:2-polyprenyl-6-hydroxyphenyl methylase/3-demethylubiquinone-9 3-methyltransferase
VDAGCGTGTIARWLASERKASVLAIDGSKEMLSHAAAVEGVEYRQRDVISTSLADCSVDGVVCSSVLEYLPQPAAALDEFRRILKPNGTLAISMPNGATSVRVPLLLVYWLTRPLGNRRWYTFLDHSKHSYHREEFALFLGNNGFRTKEIVECGGLGLPLGIKVSNSGTLLWALTTKNQ